jgi:hypothetical protein
MAARIGIPVKNDAFTMSSFQPLASLVFVSMPKGLRRTFLRLSIWWQVKRQVWQGKLSV